MTGAGRRGVRRLRVVALVVAIGTLTGCVEVVQYISGSADTLEVFLRVTLQKSAFELAAEMGGESGDLDETFEEEFNLEEDDVLGDLPEGINAGFEQVNTEFEYGFELRYKVARTLIANLIERGELSLNDPDDAFLPQVSDTGITIPLAEGGEGGGADPGGDQWAAAFLGGSKYRLMVSRRLAPSIDAARLVTATGTTELSVTELPDVFLIEFPVLLWFNAGDTARIELRY